MKAEAADKGHSRPGGSVSQSSTLRVSMVEDPKVDLSVSARHCRAYGEVLTRDFHG